jgi:Bifunctional DNA primase/polymerase, N-terminal
MSTSGGVEPRVGAMGGSMTPEGAPPPLKGQMVQYALAITRQMRWHIFPIRMVFDFGGEMRCDCPFLRCAVPGKHPRVRWGEQATDDEVRVQHLWGRAYPHDGIGIVTGEKSGLWVLDVDPKSGGEESLAALEAANGKLPKTVTVTTGSGGSHYYFKYPGSGFRNTAGLLGAGLDSRGDGGYVVGPPSLHRSNRRYAWISGPADTGLADAPDWLLKLLKTDRPAHRRAVDDNPEKQGLHAAPVPRREAKALLDQMFRHPLIQWMREYPDDVDRETWRGVAQNLACAVLDHRDLVDAVAVLFQELSEDYTGYTPSLTERTFRDAVASARNLGPMTFKHMADSGMPDEYWSKGATSLIHAARQSLRAMKEAR